MVRLEFVGLDSTEELKKVMNALVKGEEYKKSFKTQEGETKEKILCKNGRLYVGSNYSVSLSVADNGKAYLGIDYYSSEDRIKVNQSKPATTDVF